MHYNTITSNIQTGSVFRKENLADISRSETKTLFLPSGGQSTVLHYTSVPAPGDVQSAFVNTIHSHPLAHSFHNINRFYSFPFFFPAHLISDS